MSSTSKCRQCGATITFKAHPQNPQKMAPFNLDGEIHFATCESKGNPAYDYHNGDNLIVGFKEEGDGNSLTFNIIIESKVQEVRCQTLKTGSRVFLEVTGEWERNEFIRAVLNYAKEKGYTV